MITAEQKLKDLLADVQSIKADSVESRKLEAHICYLMIPPKPIEHDMEVVVRGRRYVDAHYFDGCEYVEFAIIPGSGRLFAFNNPNGCGFSNHFMFKMRCGDICQYITRLLNNRSDWGFIIEERGVTYIIANDMFRMEATIEATPKNAHTYDIEVVACPTYIPLPFCPFTAKQMLQKCTERDTTKEH